MSKFVSQSEQNNQQVVEGFLSASLCQMVTPGQGPADKLIEACPQSEKERVSSFLKARGLLPVAGAAAHNKPMGVTR